MVSVSLLVESYFMLITTYVFLMNFIFQFIADGRTQTDNI